MNVADEQASRSLMVLFAMLTAALPSFADNGVLALARPVDAITVDGDFADWPSSLPWYSIERVTSGERPEDAADFDAAFRVGYDEDALYLAIQVRDDSIIAEGRNSWRKQDGCSVYLDVGHSGERKAPLQYHIFGDHSHRSATGLAVAWSCQRSETYHRYEWRFDLQRIHGPPVKLVPGLVVGLGLIISERDQGDRLGISSRLTWGPGARKEASTTRLGDILLVSSSDGTGKVHGRLVTGAVPLPRRAVKFQQQVQTSPVTVVPDDSGEFEVELPAGEYRVFTSPAEEVHRIRVEAGATTPHLVLHGAPPSARPTEDMTSTVVTAGSGNRTGRLHHFGPDDGFPAGELWELSQTSDGALWIASEQAGLLRFDQKSLRTFGAPKSLPSLSCKSVATDHSDNVWMTADQGEAKGKLLRFDGESFVQLTTTQEQGEGPNFPTYQVVTDKGKKHWIRDRFRIYLVDDGSITPIYEKRPVSLMHSLAIESDSRVWVGTSYGLVRLDAAADSGSTGLWHETHLDTADGLPGEGPVEVRALLLDSSSRLWIGTADGLCRYDGSSFESWTDGLGGVGVVALAQTEDGTLWVGTEAGLVAYSDGVFIQIADTGHVNDLYVDREQNVWIAGRGLIRYEPQPTSPQTSSELELLGATTLMQARDGALWLGTESGVVHFKDRIAQHYSSSDGLVTGAVTSLFEDSHGGVWIGTDRGVSHFDGKEFAALQYRAGLGAEGANALAEDSTGRIWMGTQFGVTIYDPRSEGGAVARDTADSHATALTGGITHLSTMDGLQADLVNALLADSRGAVWVGMQLGVCRWRDNVVEQFEVPKEVVCFLQDDSNVLWAGGEGLYRFDGTRWQQIALDVQADIRGLAHDPEGRIWMATSAGLRVYDGFAVQTLGRSGGVPEWCSDVIWDHRENSLLVAGDRLVTYGPRGTPPPIEITHVEADREHGPTGEIRFTSSQPFVRFSYYGISFKTRPDQMLYRYRLRGLDDEWKLTQNTQASFGRLDPGEYTFEVAAIDRELSYSDQPASVLVRVDRDYGKLALWSALGSALVAVGFLSLTVVRRNRGIRRLNVDLDQRVKDRTAKLEREMAENKQLHEQLLQARKMDAVGTLASGVAHDINNSLAAIMGFAELTKSTSPESREYIGHILEAARQAAGTTRSLLTFTRVSSEERVPRDFVETVNRTTDFLRKMLPASIEFSTSFPESGSIWCSIDEVQIQQVLMNVTVNARDALPDGGNISISLGECPDRPGFAELVITDDGTGMSPEVRARILDPFFTTKARGQGTGLGMAIVYGFVESHGGTLQIASSEGQGTTVSIALPQCRAGEAQSEPPELVIDGRGETILVAEDHPDVRAMLENQLKSVGFRLLMVEDGLEAMRVLHEDEGEVKLAILDIDLPKKDGLTCLREIGVLFPDLPIILMSGLSSVDPALLSTPFLRKPFKRRELLSVVSATLGISSSGQAGTP